jgi:hypothetical protein
MSHIIYRSKRRELLANIMTAKRCKLSSVARRFQYELADLRVRAMA